MNKTVIFITFAVVIVIGFAGYIVLLAMDPTPDPARSDRVVTSLVLLLGILTTAAGQFYQLGRIEKQTNGNLSRRDDHIAALTAQLNDAGIPPTLPPTAPIEVAKAD
jgi:hypothetical protein